jgi:hypothetical protein
MTTNASCTFSVTSWKEESYSELGDTKLTTSAVSYAYAGDISGESVLTYVMHYERKDCGTCYAFERFTGAVQGKTGSFVVEHRGTFDGVGVKGLLTIVPGSGTGDLTGIRGCAVLDIAGHHPSYPLTLAYDLLPA